MNAGLLQHRPTDPAAHPVPGRVLRLGTRGSALATAQAGWVADRLRAGGYAVELVPVRTEGDLNPAPLAQIGGTGVFASALREALHQNRIDLAVHSLKDLPVLPDPGLAIVAVPPREDPLDVVISRTGADLQDLPPGARVGTGSPRRAAQVALLAPQTEVVDIRGNVGTRIGHVRAGRVDAVVLAAAGLHRLGQQAQITQRLSPEQMLPAPGQGALAVECRADDPALAAACAPLEDPDTRLATSAERTLLQRLEAGCTAPVGALCARAALTQWTVTAYVAISHTSWRRQDTGEDPVALSQALADELLAGIAGEVHPVAAPPTPTERDS